MIIPLNGAAYVFFKRSISLAAACAVILCSASCNKLTSEQTKDPLGSFSEESHDTTSSVDTSKAVSLTFEEVQNAVLGKLNYDESDLIKPDEKDMRKNSYIGIVNMIRLSPLPYYIEGSNLKEDDVYVGATILEFNTNSFEYRNLKVGEEVAFFSYAGFARGASVSAINGKFVVCLNAYKGKYGTDSYLSEYLPDYTMGNLQESYEAFAELPEVYSKPTDQPEITFDYVFTKVQGNLGSSFMNTFNQDPETAENNRSVGIVNFAYTWLDCKGKDESGNVLWLYHNVEVFEFDTDSKEYKNLNVGNEFEYYKGSEKKDCVVTAINGKFVIAFSTYKSPQNEIKNRTVENLPEFSNKGLQKAYNAFVVI